MSETVSDGDTEQGTPAVWDNGWQEGHAHGVAGALGIPYREGWLRTMRMLAGEKLDTTRPVSGVQTTSERGEQVPSIPVPFYSWFPPHRCPEQDCREAYWTRKGYRGHYALAHILGTP